MALPACAWRLIVRISYTPGGIRGYKLAFFDIFEWVLQKNVEIKAFIFAELFKIGLKFTFFVKIVSFRTIFCAYRGVGVYDYSTFFNKDL